MQARHLAALLATIAPLARPAQADGDVRPDLKVIRTPGTTTPHVTARLEGVAGSEYLLFAMAADRDAPPQLVDHGQLGPDGSVLSSLPLAGSVPLAEALLFRAVVQEPWGVRRTTNTAELECSLFSCEQLTFGHRLDASPMPAGARPAEMWASRGLRISATNNAPGHPDTVAVFDSSSPTGQDSDLATPGYGRGNDFAYGNLLIIPEDEVDGDGDGLIDDPDDEAQGGTIAFAYDSPVRVCEVVVVDVDFVDGSAGRIRTFLEGSPVHDVTVLPMGDNNVQVLFLDPFLELDRLEVELPGSGAVAQVNFLPCPIVVDFDATTTGNPVGLAAGTIVTDQFLSQNILVSAVTDEPTHPDIAVLFDTASPTGGDGDLVTPGYGPGNSEPRRLGLVMCDTDVDADMDGLVDDPGDSCCGGTLSIQFTVCSTLGSATVIDIEEAACFFEAFDVDGASLGVFPLAEAGDNSVQTVDFGGLELVRRLDMVLCGSGCLLDLSFCPTPGADD